MQRAGSVRHQLPRQRRGRAEGRYTQQLKQLRRQYGVAVPGFRRGRLLRPLPCTTRNSMRSESMSPTFSATTSETRSPAPPAFPPEQVRGLKAHGAGSGGSECRLVLDLAAGEIASSLRSSQRFAAEVIPLMDG